MLGGGRGCSFVLFLHRNGMTCRSMYAFCCLTQMRHKIILQLIALQPKLHRELEGQDSLHKSSSNSTQNYKGLVPHLHEI